MSTKTTFTFTQVKKVTIDLMDPKELTKVLNTWKATDSKAVIELAKYVEKRHGKLLSAWGEPGSRKVWISVPEEGQEVLHKVWYYTKWGWSEA